ncbi:Pleiotropic drug resistance ABC transporter family protein [Zea mays]|nr:Pleiotropic drug resistance ABC transporter family protein [Zea mays]
MYGGMYLMTDNERGNFYKQELAVGVIPFPNPCDAFGRSVREEDDDEALRWAAIEQLPIYDRMRKGILTGAAAGVEEVDIQGLGMQERKNLIERLVRTAEEDNERFLLKLRDRMERVGIDNPTIEVRFENLNIDAEAYVGNRGVPTMTNFFSNKVMDVLSAMHIVSSGKRPVSIVHDISGVIRPGSFSPVAAPQQLAFFSGVAMERVSSAPEMDEAASTDQSSRLTKRRAKVWDYVDTEVVDGKEKAVCKYCKVHLSSAAGKALKYKAALNRYAVEQHHECPTEEDWSKAEALHGFLQEFSDATKAFSADRHPIAHLFLKMLLMMRNMIGKFEAGKTLTLNQLTLYLSRLRSSLVLPVTSERKSINSESVTCLLSFQEGRKKPTLKPDPDVDVYMKAISVEGQESVVTDYNLKIADSGSGDLCGYNGWRLYDQRYLRRTKEACHNRHNLTKRIEHIENVLNDLKKSHLLNQQSSSSSSKKERSSRHEDIEYLYRSIERKVIGRDKEREKLIRSGKSTLAQYVCDYEKAEGQHFDPVMFIHVSQTFREERAILLNVLDAGQSGSRVLVTAQKKDVAAAIGAEEQIPIPDMEEKQYFSMFMHYALEGKRVGDGRFIAIGRKIAKKLGRSPIAAVTVAARLRSNSSIDFWETTANLDMLDETMGALWWSYQQIGVDVRRCFAYCSTFPRGYRLVRGELVHIWIVQGFINTRVNATEQPEDIGLHYINELRTFSFLQIERTVFGTETEAFTIHDLLHELAERVSGSECFRVVSNSSPKHIPQEVRHLFVGTGTDSRAAIAKKILGLVNLRTLIIVEEYSENKRKTFAAEDDEERVELIFPSTFSKLYHMQSIYSEKISCAKDVTQNLTSLRHSSSSWMGFANVGRLTSLQSLRYFQVKREQGHELKQLKHLNNLRGTLAIDGLGVAGDPNAVAEILNRLLPPEDPTNHRYHGWMMGGQAPDVAAEVLEGLCPPKDLATLTINRYKGSSMPENMEPLVSLQSVLIMRCDRMERLPTLPRSLAKVEIHGCRVLSRTCQSEGHENWQKILHIPEKNISPRRSMAQ